MSESSFNDGMEAIITSNFSLIEVQRNSMVISGSSTLRSKDNSEFYELNGKYFRYDIRGTRMSRIVIDRKTGWVLNSSISQSIGGDSFLKPSDEMLEEIAIPITIDNEIAISNK